MLQAASSERDEQSRSSFAVNTSLDIGIYNVLRLVIKFSQAPNIIRFQGWAEECPCGIVYCSGYQWIGDLYLAERRACARLSQSVEHETLNLRVVGSSPTLGANCSFSFYGSIAFPFVDPLETFVHTIHSFLWQAKRQQAKKKGNIAITQLKCTI